MGGDRTRDTLHINTGMLLQIQACERLSPKGIDYFCPPYKPQSTGFFNRGLQRPGNDLDRSNGYAPDQGQNNSRPGTQIHLQSLVCQESMRVTVRLKSQGLLSKWHDGLHSQPFSGTTSPWPCPQNCQESMLVSAHSHPRMPRLRKRVSQYYAGITYRTTALGAICG